jgi:hypothetical protein
MFVLLAARHVGLLGVYLWVLAHGQLPEESSVPIFPAPRIPKRRSAHSSRDT